MAVRAWRAVVDGQVRPATVLVRNGVITAIEPYESDGSHRAEAEARVVTETGPDEVLAPGLVDTHVHVNEPGRTEWEGFATATAAALDGGVTTLVDMPLNSLPPTLTVDALERKRQAAAGRCRVDVAFWGGVTPATIGELPALFGAGVPGVKGFLSDSGVAEFPPLSDADLSAAAAMIADLDGVLLVHAEDPGLLERAAPPEGRSYQAFVASRPVEAEVSAIRRVVDVAERTGCRVHVVHVSSGAGVEEIRRAKGRGVPISAETCPHYLVFAAETIPDGAPEYKCCPPVRGRDDRERLWAGLLDGTLDIVVTDHSPSTPELKHLDTGDLDAAWGGISSLQFGFAATWTAAAERGVDLARVVQWMSTGPADLVGMPRKGRIGVGADADLVALAPDERFAVQAERIRHRHPHTPYLGHELRGVVRRRWLRGVEPDRG
ncbi:allantoinase AllB [Actinobacteria bacterium YIM 96077]|uniref:allantoinase n=1 Tax=Phytoactinopolyspora halophila TaxID=1981511 RepID=A0A329R1X3_9ACTN|nr:allantoinase AllB [Actinobacteria bacterium YIM 96077]RAW18176.1 allantoinase AllB [Phytoactinopolyspora halophila]